MFETTHDLSLEIRSVLQSDDEGEIMECFVCFFWIVKPLIRVLMQAHRHMCEQATKSIRSNGLWKQLCISGQIWSQHLRSHITCLILFYVRRKNTKRNRKTKCRMCFYVHMRICWFLGTFFVCWNMVRLEFLEQKDLIPFIPYVLMCVYSFECRSSNSNRIISPKKSWDFSGFNIPKNMAHQSDWFNPILKLAM